MQSLSIIKWVTSRNGGTLTQMESLVDAAEPQPEIYPMEADRTAVHQSDQTTNEHPTHSRRRHWTPAWNLPHGDSDRTAVHQSDQTTIELPSKDLCHRPKRWQCRWEQRWLPYVQSRRQPFLHWPKLSTWNFDISTGSDLRSPTTNRGREPRHMVTSDRPTDQSIRTMLIYLPLKQTNKRFRQRNLISRTFYQGALAAPFVPKNIRSRYKQDATGYKIDDM